MVSYKKIFLSAFILILYSVDILAQGGGPTGGGPGNGQDPDSVPINGLAILLVLIAKGLGIYKIVKSKKKK